MDLTVIAAATAASSFIPAAEVISELEKSPLPREAKAAMAALSTETLIGNPPSWPYSWSPFRCEFGFTEWTGSLATFPDWGGNAEHKTHAIGVWQDEPATYAGIVALTGNPGFNPQDQVSNNWVLAVRDYGRHTNGAGLLEALRAGQIDTVSPALIATWPGGANSGFAARYAAALMLFPVQAPPPAPPPPGPPPPTPPPPPSVLEIPLGEQCTIEILMAADESGRPVTHIPSDLLKPDDQTICSAEITGMTLVIEPLAIGETVLRGADQAQAISVVQPIVVRLVPDWAHPVFSPMAAIKAMAARMPMLAMAGALLLFGATAVGPMGPEKPPAAEIAFFPELPAEVAPVFIFPPSKEAAKMNTLDAPAFGSTAFCLRPDQPAFAVERCLRWTDALLHH